MHMRELKMRKCNPLVLLHQPSPKGDTESESWQIATVPKGDTESESWQIATVPKGDAEK